MENKFKRGRGFNGGGSIQGSITYNGETATLNEWARLLKSNVHTLRGKALKAERGEMSWEDAMAGIDGRAEIQVRNRRIKRNKLAKEKRTEAAELNKRPHASKSSASLAIDSFLYRSAP